MKTRDLVINAMFVALVMAMSLIPGVGFINLGIIAVTVIHIPVIVGAIAFGWKTGVLLGLAFGISSWVNAVTASPSIFAPVFANPIVSVLPRVIFGLLASMIYVGLSKVFKGKVVMNAAITAAVATTLHSLMVLPLLYYFGLGFSSLQGSLNVSVVTFVTAAFAANSISEIVIAAIIVPLVIPVILKLNNARS